MEIFWKSVIFTTHTYNLCYKMAKGGRVLKICGGSPPVVQPLTLYIPILMEKVPLLAFVYLLLRNGTSFTCLA